jgi:hypothetical protein
MSVTSWVRQSLSSFATLLRFLKHDHRFAPVDLPVGFLAFQFFADPKITIDPVIQEGFGAWDLTA